MKYLVLFLVLFIFQRVVSQDTALTFNATMMDTVKKQDIDRLCDLCALSVRFKVDKPVMAAEYVDVIFLFPHFEKMKPNGKYTVIARAKYSGPKVLISPVKNYKDEVPVLWCSGFIPVLKKTFKRSYFEN